ncbi:MAG: CHASE2 domain-containing protein, partial [Candidatus Eremiobacteraeota bacterium]|nr:CHASE2 domain-containing protein [Candidatus Eremiobacteraeota bacterium]
MKARVRTLVVALALSALSALIWLALYLAPADFIPFLSRPGDYIIHQNALANAGAFALPNVPDRSQPSDSLALIAIDDLSAKGSPRAGLPPFPYPRSVYGTLLKHLHAAGAKLVVFDVNFLENSADPAQDAVFADGLRAMPTILTYDITTTS